MFTCRRPHISSGVHSLARTVPPAVFVEDVHHGVCVLPCFFPPRSFVFARRVCLSSCLPVVVSACAKGRGWQDCLSRSLSLSLGEWRAL